jgi:hypothetical protein
VVHVAVSELDAEFETAASRDALARADAEPVSVAAAAAGVAVGAPDREAVGEALSWQSVKLSTMSCMLGFESATISMPRVTLAAAKKSCACACTSGHADALWHWLLVVVCRHIGSNTAKLPAERLRDEAAQLQSRSHE